MARTVPRDTCSLCGRSFPRSELIPAELIRPAITAVISAERPEWPGTGSVCQEDLRHFRAAWVEDVLESERGQLSDLEADVVRSIREQELVVENLNRTFDESLTFGERLADRVALFGGSWTFISLFAATLAAWICINSVALMRRPFDPFPYILLNLVLSCLAAIQAPVIMMSQNRQAAKDRLQAEHDYRVNLQAELEVRHLNAKIDLLLTNLWSRLLEMQQVQVDLLTELTELGGRHGGGTSRT
jgi:uncharacterized membrane protein